MTIGVGADEDGEAANALIAEARRRVRPFDLATRRLTEVGFVANLMTDDGRVAHPDYASGPSVLLAVLAAEQRYLVEQEGRGSVPGATYLDKAIERVRRGPSGLA